MSVLTVDRRDLRPADLLLSAGRDRIATWIRHGTHSKVSHALLYIGDASVVDTIGTLPFAQSVFKNPLSTVIERSTAVYAFRCDLLQGESRERVVAFALRQAKTDGHRGKHYGWGELLGQVTARWPRLHVHLPHWITHTAGFICSELVVEAFREGGISIVNGDSEEAAPGTIRRAVAHTHRLRYLGRVT